jgi:hypothetical protein
MARNSDMPSKSGLKLGAGRPSSTVGSAKSKSVRPKNVNKNIKVSQSEINSIKKLGMKKALEIAAMNKGSEQAGAVASFAEGVRRLYGETRFQNAVYTPKASPGPATNTLNLYGAAKPRLGGNSNAREDRKPKPAVPNPNRANVREGRVAGPKPAAKKPMTPYQKDMARRGIYNA